MKLFATFRRKDCFEERTRVCSNAKQTSNGLWLQEVEPHEENYPTHDLELVAIIFALKACRHYLYGVCFKMLRNYKSLKYRFEQKELSMQKKKVDEIYERLQFHIEIPSREG